MVSVASSSGSAAKTKLVAVLVDPAGASDELKLGVEYRGFPVEQVATGTWVQRHTLAWYPHAGSVDRATYTLTIHRPKRPRRGGARRLHGSRPRPGRPCSGSCWCLDRPSIGVSFELGDFDFATGKAGDVEVTVAVDRLGARIERRLEDEILETVTDAVEYYSDVFGPYPLKHLRVVSSPRGYSQGLLGYVSLSTSAMVDWSTWGALLGIEDRRTVIAHEVAHQWWGNLVGWRGYRDQWISEAMANYAGALVGAKQSRPDGGTSPGPRAHGRLAARASSHHRRRATHREPRSAGGRRAVGLFHQLEPRTRPSSTRRVRWSSICSPGFTGKKLFSTSSSSWWRRPPTVFFQPMTSCVGSLTSAAPTSSGSVVSTFGGYGVA